MGEKDPRDVCFFEKSLAEEFMFRILPGVEKDHGYGVKVTLSQPNRDLADLLRAQFLFNPSFGSDPFVYLEDPGMEDLRFSDTEAEDIGAVLVSDFEKVGKPLRDQQGGPSPFSFQKGVGCHSGSETDPRDPRLRERRAGRQAENPADPLDGSRFIGGGRREQFEGMELPFRRKPHYVRKGSPPIHGKTPWTRWHAGLVLHFQTPLSSFRKIMKLIVKRAREKHKQGVWPEPGDKRCSDRFVEEVRFEKRPDCFFCAIQGSAEGK